MSAYAYGVSYRHLEAISTEASAQFVKLGRKDADIAHANRSLNSYRRPHITHSNATELFEMDFRWRVIRIYASILGAFGFVCMYCLLTTPRMLYGRELRV
jgi:hypothetical protein